MRLCGRDCVVRGRYDLGSAGSGRYFYRLDPQDPLNFGIILSNLYYTLASGRSPHAGLRIGTHTVHGGTYARERGKYVTHACTRSCISRDLCADT